MSDDLGRTVGGAVGGPLYGVVQDRLARAAASYLDEGEELAAPGALGSRGGGIFGLAGFAVIFATLMVLVVAGDRLGAAGDVVFLAGMALGLLLLLMMLPFASNYAVILTDRRLLLFRMGKLSFTQHLRGVYLAAPRSDVSAAFNDRWGSAVLSLEFSPATGQAPMQLWFMNVHKLAARNIHQALMTPASGAGVSPLPGMPA